MLTFIALRILFVLVYITWFIQAQYDHEYLKRIHRCSYWYIFGKNSKSKYIKQLFAKNIVQIILNRSFIYPANFQYSWTWTLNKWSHVYYVSFLLNKDVFLFTKNIFKNLQKLFTRYHCSGYYVWNDLKRMGIFNP